MSEEIQFAVAVRKTTSDLSSAMTFSVTQEIIQFPVKPYRIKSKICSIGTPVYKIFMIVSKLLPVSIILLILPILYPSLVW